MHPHWAKHIASLISYGNLKRWILFIDSFLQMSKLR